jgi:hypothetical protein
VSFGVVVEVGPSTSTTRVRTCVSTIRLDSALDLRLDSALDSALDQFEVLGILAALLSARAAGVGD